MIVVDTSALVRVALQESGAHDVLAVMQKPGRIELSVGNYLETVLVLRSRQPDFSIERLEVWLQALGIDCVAIDKGLADIAAKAAVDFGKGSGHPAQLNYGDCFAYALAKARRAPLLYVGQDFVHTDIRSALATARP